MSRFLVGDYIYSGVDIEFGVPHKEMERLEAFGPVMNYLPASRRQRSITCLTTIHLVAP